jgi:hypothetical protein
MTEAVLNLEATPAQLIERYVKLRDEKKANEDRYATFMREHFGGPMEEIEMKLLDILNKTGGDNFASPAGTVYKTLKTSITVADGREFQRHIIGGELWDLIEWRPAKTAINDLIDNGEPLPPGLNRSVFATVNIRRPR